MYSFCMYHKPITPTFWEWIAPKLATVAAWAVLGGILWWVGFGTAYAFLIDPAHAGIGAIGFVIWWLAAILFWPND